jgi:hypothetical protein
MQNPPALVFLVAFDPVAVRAEHLILRARIRKVCFDPGAQLPNLNASGTKPTFTALLEPPVTLSVI